jgi:hypothetical protein
MLRYALRPGPTLTTAGAVAGMAGLLWLVGRWPWEVWPLAAVAAAVLGGAAATLLDEPAAAIVDTLPRPFWWRAAARLLLAGVLAGAWIVGVALVGVAPTGRPDVVRLEGVALILIGVGSAAVLRRRGRSAPGSAVAGGLVVITVFAALQNPIHRWLPLFSYGPDGTWDASARLWTGLALAAVAVLGATCVETARRHVP